MPTRRVDTTDQDAATKYVNLMTEEKELTGNSSKISVNEFDCPKENNVANYCKESLADLGDEGKKKKLFLPKHYIINRKAMKTREKSISPVNKVSMSKLNISLLQSKPSTPKNEENKQKIAS